MEQNRQEDTPTPPEDTEREGRVEKGLRLARLLLLRLLVVTALLCVSWIVVSCLLFAQRPKLSECEPLVRKQAKALGFVVVEEYYIIPSPEFLPLMCRVHMRLRRSSQPRFSPNPPSLARGLVLASANGTVTCIIATYRGRVTSLILKGDLGEGSVLSETRDALQEVLRSTFGWSAPPVREARETDSHAFGSHRMPRNSLLGNLQRRDYGL